MSQQLISTIKMASLSPNYQCVISALMKRLQGAAMPLSLGQAWGVDVANIIKGHKEKQEGD